MVGLCRVKFDRPNEIEHLPSDIGLCFEFLQLMFNKSFLIAEHTLQLGALW